jgi:soluble lytic murein transglycosylase
LVDNNGDFANMPATLRGAIPPGKYDDVLGFAGKLSKGTPVETDWNVYERLRTEARERPQEFARIDLASTFHKLAPAQREALIDLQDKAKKDPKGMAEVATLDAQLGDAHDKLGLTGNGKAEKRGLFDETVRREISAAQATKGKPLTYEERQTIIERNAVKRDQWFGTTRLFEAKAEGKAGDFKPEVPRGDRAQITEALQRRGIPVTEANILELYRRRLGLSGAAAPRSGAGVTGEF